MWGEYFACNMFGYIYSDQWLVIQFGGKGWPFLKLINKNLWIFFFFKTTKIGTLDLYLTVKFKLKKSAEVTKNAPVDWCYRSYLQTCLNDEVNT